MSETLIKVENVSKKFCRDLKRSLWYGMKDLGNELLCQSGNTQIKLRKYEFWALKDVSFELKRGECLGLIGPNGAGKTTLLRMLNGLIKPDKGHIEMHGRVGALIALGAGFNPVLTGRENIYVNATVLGLSKKEIDLKFEEILEFAELGDFIDAPVQSYSSGMTVRLGFAIASTLKPNILLLDEVLAVGDAKFRSKCWRRIGELLQDAAVILVSHEAYAISRICDRAILMDKGHIHSAGTTSKILDLYAKMGQLLRPKSLRFLHKKVRNLDLIFKSNNIIKPGDCIEFEMVIDSRETISIDHAVININDMSGDVHAQCLLKLTTPSLFEGINHFFVSIGPLFLSDGSFSLMILISTAGGKVPIIHSRQELSFYFESHVNYGPKYYPPGLLTSKRNSPNHFRESRNAEKTN